MYTCTSTLKHQKGANRCGKEVIRKENRKLDTEWQKYQPATRLPAWSAQSTTKQAERRIINSRLAIKATLFYIPDEKPQNMCEFHISYESLYSSGLAYL